ncbi:MAG TPA: GWxTD domain-containing protein [Thermoanaerobaculia bacterium]
MRRFAVSALALLACLSISAATLPELFQKAKDQFRLADYRGALATLETLNTESEKPGLEQMRTKILPGLFFYRGASLASLGRSAEARESFERFLSYQPDARLDPALFPKAVFSALENARKSIEQKRATGGTDALAAAYRSFPAPGPFASTDAGEDWSAGAVRYLMTADERRDFSRLSDAVSRSSFISDFWKSRDPKPETPENEFREEFEKRVAFADSRLTQEETRGSMTDRGMVFVLLGPPSYSGRKPLRTGDDIADASGLWRYTRSEVSSAYRGGGNSAERSARIEKVTGPASTVQDPALNHVEVWHYLREAFPKEIPYQELDFAFVTKVGYGENVLQRDDRALAALERAKVLARRGEAVRGGGGDTP